VGLKINTSKLELLKKAIGTDVSIQIQQVEEPKKEAFVIGQNEGTKLLRQSTDDLALRGYLELATELAKIENLSAVFIPTSSGTTAQGLATGFKQNGLSPQIHIAQTSSCHPLVDTIYHKKNMELPDVPTEISLAQSIVDQVGHRKETVAEMVIESNGAGWIITNEEILQAIDMVKKTLNLSISPTSALSVAALYKAIQNHHPLGGAVVCLITGN
jgi:threonine dehydratase